MNLQRLETFEIEKGDIEVVAGRVAVENGVEIVSYRTSDTVFILQCLKNHFAEHHGRCGGAIQQVRQMKAQRTLQLIMIKNSRVQKAR